MKNYKRHFLLALSCLVLCMFAAACGTPKSTVVKKVLKGASASFTQAWDYLQLNEEPSANFWVKTTVLSNYRSDERGRRAGTIYFRTDAGETYLFIDKADATATVATVYMVGRTKDGEANRAYATEIPFEGANHQATIQALFHNGVYYLQIDGHWTVIDGSTTPVSSEGDYDFFTKAEKLYGIGNSGVGSSTHENVTGGAQVEEKLKECQVNLTVRCADGGTADLSDTTVLMGQEVTLTVTPSEESLVPTVTYAGRQISASGMNIYKFRAIESGEITITFTRAYLVEGNYGYADGLYANGDEVTVQSKTAGLFGTAANGKFRIRLPAGTHSVILTSARFEAIGFDVTVREKDVRVTGNNRFTQIKFESGNVPADGRYRLQNGNYELFAGVSLKNFYATMRVERMDKGESTSGIYYYTQGSVSPVKILLLKAENDTVKIRLTRGKGWDDRSDRDYTTAVPWKEVYRLSVLSFDDTLYVGIDDNWLAIDRKTAYTPVVKNADFDEATVWNAGAEKTFGVFANGESGVGFPITEIAYTAGTQEVRNACYATLKVDCSNKDVQAVLNKTKVLKGTEPVVLTLKGADDRYMVTVTYAGRQIPASGNHTYTFTPAESGSVKVSLTRVYPVTGGYGYVDGLYAKGDTVMVHSQTTGTYGTAADGKFRIRLPDGRHTLVLTSARFESIRFDVTVRGGRVDIPDMKRFSQVKFAVGKVPNGGNYTLRNGDYELFSGVSLKDFFVTATVRRMDQGEATSGVFFYAGGASPVKVLLLRADDGNTKIRLMRGVGWDDRSDRDYATAIPWKEVFKLSVLSYSDTLYVGIDEKWTAINRDTPYKEVVKNVAFDPATVWNAEAEKTFGLYANGESDEGFPVTDIAYKAGTQEVKNACYATLTVDCADKNVKAVLNKASVLKGTEPVTLTLNGVDDRYMAEVTFEGRRIAPDENGKYTFIPAHSGTVTITFTRVYLVEGSYGYDAGLYTTGDKVSIYSETAALYGTAGDGKFRIRLPDGTHSLVLTSERFAPVRFEIVVKADNVHIAEQKQFKDLKFVSGHTTKDSAITLPPKSYELFAGVSMKDFFATARVQRMDQGEATSGIYYYAGGNSPVKVLLLKADNNMFKIRLTRGLDWDDRSDRDYTTAIPWQEEARLSVLSIGNTLYVGIDDQWTAIGPDTPHKVVVHNVDFDEATVWNAGAEKSFGVFANGDSAVGFPITGIAYQPGTRDACMADLTVRCEDEGVTAHLDKTSVLKGTEPVTLTLSGLDDTRAATVSFGGHILTATGDNTYIFTAAKSGVVEVSITRVYPVEGRYIYAQGLYAHGDTVTIRSETAGIIGTAADGKFRIRLPDGTHSLVLTSARFAPVHLEVAVNGGAVNMPEVSMFEELMFGSGLETKNGAVTLLNDQYEPFAGVALTDFFVTARVRRMDQGESTGGVYYYVEGAASPVKILPLRADDGNVKVRLTRGKGWDDRSDRDYATNIPWREEMTLSVLSIGDTLYVGVDGNWMAISRDTPYTQVVHNVEFDEKTVWDANTLKIFGVFANGASEIGFPITDIAYNAGTQEIKNACYADLTVRCDDESVTGTLDKTRVLKGTEPVMLTLSGMDESCAAVVTFAGRILTPDAENRYTFTAAESGEVVVTIARTYSVTGTYGYAPGLYADGDVVTICSETAGITGTAADGKFHIRLPDGTHSLALTSARFAPVRLAVTVESGVVTVPERCLFKELKFTDGKETSNSAVTLQNGDYEAFAGIALKDFFATTRVKRMDQGESTGGIYYYTEGASSPVKILLLRADDGTVKIRLTRGTGWDDRSDRDYTTAIPWQEELTLSVLSLGDTLYVGVEGQWTAIGRNTSYTQVVHNTDFDEATVWNADAVKTFGLFANGASDRGFPIADVRYAAGTQEACYVNLTVRSDDEKVIGVLDKPKALKGTDSVTLTLSGMEPGSEVIVTYAGRRIPAKAENTYMFTAAEAMEVLVYTRFAEVGGSYGCAEGLYADGDAVTVRWLEGETSAVASDGTFGLRLPDGSHTLVLESARFVSVQFKATVKDGQLTVSETPRFTEVKFASGHAPTNGNYILQNNDYEQFAGVALKDFYVTLQVKRMDQGESTSGIYYYTEGASSPVKILLLRADDDTVKIRLTRGTGWDDRSDRDYVTAIPWQEELALSVVSLGDTLHVGVNGTWTAISRSTSYKEVVHNVDFDEATVWNADAVKTFGIFANGASDTGFPVTGIAYSSGVQQPLAYLEKRRRP